MAASTSVGDGNDTEKGDDHELKSLDSTDSMSNAQQPSPDRIIKAFKDEIKESIKNNASQLFMTITSEMYVMTTTPKDGAMYYIVPYVLSVVIMLNVLALLVLILVRKWAFKTPNGQYSTRAMAEARKLQKYYWGLSILLFALQILFTIVTGVSISGVMDDDPKNDTSTVTIATTTIGEYVVNTTSG